MRRDFSEEYDPTIEGTRHSIDLPCRRLLRSCALTTGSLALLFQDSYTVTLNVDGQDYTIELHDCAGQEEYRGLWQEDTVRQGDAFILT